MNRQPTGQHNSNTLRAASGYWDEAHRIYTIEEVYPWNDGKTIKEFFVNGYWVGAIVQKGGKGDE